MPIAKLKLHNNDTITVSGLPAKVTIPAVEAGIITGVVVKRNGTEVESGTVIDILPSDVFTVEYVYHDYPTVSVSGTMIFDAYLDGEKQVVLDDHTLEFEFQTNLEDQKIVVQGEQPQPYVLTFDNTESTTIYANGEATTNATVLETTKDTHIRATANPIPVHIEKQGTARVQINGVAQSSADFTIQVQGPTEIDIDASTCNLTIDYGDNSYTVQVPQGMITVCAVHRDWWLFDCWSSQDVGIESPKLVKTNVDLTGVQAATLVCHYQKYPAYDKPGIWN